MSEVLRVVGTIAGIGGIALAVLLLVFRDVIRKNIFPQLTKDQGFALINRIILFVLIATLAGIAAWVLSLWAPRHNGRDESRQDEPPARAGGEAAPRALLDVADLRFSRSGEAVVLDVTFRNPGEEVAVLKECGLVIDKVWGLRPHAETARKLGSQGTYFVNIPVQKNPTYVEAEPPVSHEIPAGTAEKLTLRITALEPGGKSWVVKGRVRGVYNAENHVVESGCVVFFLKLAGQFFQPVKVSEVKLEPTVAENLRQAVIHNKRVIADLSTTGCASDELVSGLLQAIADSSPE